MTSEEIVKALREDCKTCSESLICENGTNLAGLYCANKDAADLIERVTADVADLRKELEWKDMVIVLAQREQAKAEAERDAAIADLKISSGCTSCKYHCSDTIFCRDCTKKQNCKCISCSLGLPNWEWRGLPEAPEEGEKDADCQRRD